MGSSFDILKFVIEIGLSPSKKVRFICFDEKKYFYYTLKPLFDLKVLESLS